MRIGSLCSGYGGLDMGVQSVLGGSVAWHVEYDRDPSRILAHHWPDVPNHGDVKHTDWASVEPVDILTAGYPCQPFSHAGKRKGADDPRHLWPDVARAIGALRPSLVVLENVRGHVSLGLADVLADLSGLGYDATWGVVRAADAGAPHGRARIFIVATPDAERADGWAATGFSRASGEHLGTARRVEGPTSPDGDRAASPDAGMQRLQRGAEPGTVGGAVVAAGTPTIRGRLAPADAGRERHGRGQDTAGVGRVDGRDALPSRERERPRGFAGDRGAAAPADAAGERRGEGRPESARIIGGSDAAVSGGAVAPDADEPGPQGGEPAWGRDVPAWGAYEPAVARWESVLGRPAPRPTEPGRNGPRLSPAFVEWLMGLPAGHVTDVPDLSRNAQLKALGNGVVPAQAALALRTLLTLERAA